MNGNGEDLIKRILSLLKEHPEGLPISDISLKLKIHRHTASKYILYLEGSGDIVVRKIGSVSLIYKKGAFAG